MKTRPFRPGEQVPDNPPPLDDDFLDYLRRRLANGWITVQSAVEGIRARAPHLGSAQAKKRLEKAYE